MGLFNKPVTPIPVYVGCHVLDDLEINCLNYIRVKHVRITVTLNGWLTGASYQSDVKRKADMCYKQGLNPLIVIHTEVEAWPLMDVYKEILTSINQLFPQRTIYQIGNENDIPNTGFYYLTPEQAFLYYKWAQETLPNNFVVPIALAGDTNTPWSKRFSELNVNGDVICKNLYGEPLDQGLRRIFDSRPNKLAHLWVTETGSTVDQNYTIDLIKYNDKSHNAQRLYLYQLIEYDQNNALSIFSKTGQPTKLANYLRTR